MRRSRFYAQCFDRGMPPVPLGLFQCLAKRAFVYALRSWHVPARCRRHCMQSVRSGHVCSCGWLANLHAVAHLRPGLWPQHRGHRHQRSHLQRVRGGLVLLAHGRRRLVPAGQQPLRGGLRPRGSRHCVRRPHMRLVRPGTVQEQRHQRAVRALADVRRGLGHVARGHCRCRPPLRRVRRRLDLLA